jgi:hypothetical protein
MAVVRETAFFNGLTGSAQRATKRGCVYVRPELMIWREMADENVTVPSLWRCE